MAALADIQVFSASRIHKSSPKANASTRLPCWSIAHVPLADVANQEKAIPAEFIATDGMGITETCRRYLVPLIQGEAYPPYKNGLPDYIRLKNQLVAQKL